MNIKKFNKDFKINEDDNIRDVETVEEMSNELVSIVNPNTLPEEIFNFLNERITDEYTAHYFYRSAANWCKNVNYKKAATFFDMEANSELEHAKGLQDYITQWNMIPVISSNSSNHNFDGIVDIINKAYQMEYELLLKYSQNQNESLGKHPATFNFFQSYVNKQNDAVAEYSDLLNALQLVNIENKLDLLVFEDKYFN